MALTPEKAIENFKKLVDDFDCRVSQIFLANPETLLGMDMKQFPSNCYFISQPFVKKDEFLMVKDKNLKKELYEFARDNPDRVFQGEDAEAFYKVIDKRIQERGIR